MVEQSVGLLPARMSQRPVALCPGPHRVSCSWHQPPHRAGKHNGYTGLVGMEWGPQPGLGSQWNWNGVKKISSWWILILEGHGSSKEHGGNPVRWQRSLTLVLEAEAGGS